MDFEHWRNDASRPEAEYRAFVEWLSNRTVDEFRTARGDSASERAVCRRYFARGYRAKLTTGELNDFLGVSSPSILERAGYDDDEVEKVFSIVSNLTDDEIAETSDA